MKTKNKAKALKAKRIKTKPHQLRLNSKARRELERLRLMTLG